MVMPHTPAAMITRSRKKTTDLCPPSTTPPPPSPPPPPSSVHHCHKNLIRDRKPSPVVARSDPAASNRDMSRIGQLDPWPGLVTVYHHHMMHMIHHVPCPVVPWLPAPAAPAVVHLSHPYHHQQQQQQQQQQQCLNSCQSSVATPCSSPAISASNAVASPPHQEQQQLAVEPSTVSPEPSALGSVGALPIRYLAPPTAINSLQPVPTVPLNYFYAQRGVYYDPVPWNQSFGMERVWLSQFSRIFSQFHTELWSIQAVSSKPRTADGIKLHIFIDSAKVRYCCERCNHCWTSMKGRVVFWFALLQPSFDVGIVACKLYGQRCDMCNLEGTFEQPMWYPEEVTKVLMNLFYRVGEVFYGFEKTKYERQLRMGKPRTEHNKTLCQACHEGICQFRGVFNQRGKRAAGTSRPSCNESYDSEDSGVTESDEKPPPAPPEHQCGC